MICKCGAHVKGILAAAGGCVRCEAPALSGDLIGETPEYTLSLYVEGKRVGRPLLFPTSPHCVQDWLDEIYCTQEYEAAGNGADELRIGEVPHAPE